MKIFFQTSKKNILKSLLDILKNKKNENVIVFLEEKIKRQKKGKTERIVIQTAKDEKALLKEQKDFFQFLSKQKFSQEFRKPTNYEIADWIKKQAQNLGSEIAPQAIDALIGLLGDDMRQLKNEIEKLSAYKANTKEKLIQSEDVLELSRGRFDDNIFSLTDKISQANTGETVRILEEQIEGGISENYILTMAIRQFKIILRVKEALEKNPNSSQIASQLKLHPFVVQKSIAQSRNFTKEKLKQILNSLLEADLKTKTGQANLKTMLDLVFIN